MNFSKNAPKVPALWMNILFTVSLALIILFAIDVPHDLQTGFNARVASKELHDIRFPSHKTRAELLQPQSAEKESRVYNKIVKLCGTAVSCIDDYEKASAYNRVLGKLVVNFKIAFQDLIDSVTDMKIS